MNKRRHLNFWPAVYVLLFLMLLLLLTGCVESESPSKPKETILGEFDIIKVKFHKNGWSGDYYLVTLAPGTEIRVRTVLGDLPFAGTRMKLVKLGSSTYILRKIEEE